ncbi:COQ9 family protein [Paracoccus sp. S-4012]|uniref:COQ9 family protein n=1 Tax=Paracoccus sp. S-4012 TaxID=2665648 RepID=UPI0012B0C006|nr:COQ9 family protein [Paracoccus sp. S-4012]MRX49239.1 COQ9 family protein [Paracoccus sp. S-4012]
MTDPAAAPPRDADRLLDAALLHVPFDGMNARALAAGAADLGLDRAYAEALISGGAGLAAAYHRRGDAALRASLAANPPTGRFRERVAEAVMRRLSFSDPELVRAGAAVLSLPVHGGLGARLIGETADAIWDGLGDRSDDLAWWTKRATLGAVYAATVLYWMGDRSAGLADTRAFLERRIEGVMRFEEVKTRARRLPGWNALARATTGWVRAPRSAHAGGRS